MQFPATLRRLGPAGAMLIAVVLMYVTSFFLPVFDNGETSHMEIRPRGLVRGGTAFIRSGSLLLGMLSFSPIDAGLKSPRFAFIWLTLAWLANPFFWASIGLLAWGKPKLGAAFAAVATFLALNACVALRDDSVVRSQQFQIGYHLWLGSMACVTLVALWEVARGTVARPRSALRAAGIAGAMSLPLALALAAGHRSAARLTQYVPLRTAAEFATLMQSPDPNQRNGALHRLSELKEPEASQPQVSQGILRAVEDTDSRVRSMACVLLPYRSGLPMSEVIPALRRRLQDEDEGVRTYAARAIRLLSKGKAEWQDDNAAARETVVELLTHASRNTRISVLGGITDDGPASLPLLPAVADLLDDPDPSIRGMAVQALTRISPPGPPEVLKALSDPDPQVLRWAAEAAEHMGPAAATHVAELGRLVRHSEILIGSPSARALVKIGAEAVPEFIEALSSNDSFVLQRAVTSLAELGAAAAPALPALERLSKDPVSTVAMEAARAMEAIRAAQSDAPKAQTE